ncbi:CLUMA_CG008899, isoform A [Clunio marinus]|uniref:CLUMA_CG008899, isoform A n=1 Tax=Clunio marinus TaxID=568069 RepID=A0A1J1I504_9DIPT|nr:CLUMA_CG008899, isoform A [Clunio marinus]
MTIKSVLSMKYIFVVILMFELSSGRPDLHDVILSPHPERMFGGKYVFFHPKQMSGKNRIIESSTKVPWEEPLKETANLALANSKISKSSIFKAPYIGFINLDAPTFGDIAVLAKGKLKRNTNETFSFEQINESCDEKCQTNPDKYLENVTALWMVERIRHRDVSNNNHRYDLKFTIVPIYDDGKHQIDQNILENRLKSHMKRTFILRDTDYPVYFQPIANKRVDLFPFQLERSLSDFMKFSPNSFMQSLLGIKPTTTTPPTVSQYPIPQKLKQKHKIINRPQYEEFYMSPKIINSVKSNFHPTVNSYANEHHLVRFPDSREMFINKIPVNLYRPKPELYNKQNFIDYRGANDNVFVSSSDHQLTQPPVPSIVPVFSIPLDMPLIQVAQSPGYFQGAFPFQIQLTTNPTNQQPIYPQPQDPSHFRYQPRFVSLSHQQSPQLFNQYTSYNAIQPNKSKPFQESERYTMNYYSQVDPIYHNHHPHQHLLQQSPTEAPIDSSTHLPRFINYANVLRSPPIEQMPIESTASSIQVNMFDDNEFRPITPSYDVRKLTQLYGKTAMKVSTTSKSEEDLNNSQTTISSVGDIITGTYITSTTEKTVFDDKKVKDDYEGSYKVVAERTKASQKTTEKPILKWTPKKKQKNVLLNNTLATTTTMETKTFVPTIIPEETSTKASSKIPSKIYRGRNRFNRRNSTLLSSSNVRTVTISPTKISRKKLSRFGSQQSSQETRSSLFPAYITPEPITLKSLSTSISLEVNGERIYDVKPSTPGYEYVPASVETIGTNSTNVKLFKASIVPENFDDLTTSILKHAKILENEEKNKH